MTNDYRKKIQHIASLIEEGYTSGHYPHWTLELGEQTSLHPCNDETMQAIAKLVLEGNTEGYHPRWVISITENISLINLKELPGGLAVTKRGTTNGVAWAANINKGLFTFVTENNTTTTHTIRFVEKTGYEKQLYKFVQDHE